MKKLVILGMLVGLLVGCSHGPVRVHGADVSVDDTRIRIHDRDSDEGYYEDDGDYPRRKGHFCPPGQAKKGRC